MSHSIPAASVDLTGNEEQYVLQALRSSWISSTGEFVAKFERDFATACAVNFAIGTCNGTVALHLAMLALDVRPGDEVLVPSLTYVATANAIRYVGAEPVFVDVDPQTWCIDPMLLENSITPRTKGIIAVHLYGHPADMDRINHIAAVHGLWVVEDAAEAPFATYKERSVGGLAQIGTFSFYGNKLITCGEGGAVTINNEQLAIRARTLWGQGMDPKRQYYFPVTGYNFRLTNVACAILCAQLERVETIIEKRKRIYARYLDQLSSIAGIGFQPTAEWAKLSPWLFCITVDQDQCGISRDDLMRALKNSGIDTRPFFIPLHTLPPFRERSRQRGEQLRITSSLSASGINLPTYTLMTDDVIDSVCDVIRKNCAARA